MPARENVWIEKPRTPKGSYQVRYRDPLTGVKRNEGSYRRHRDVGQAVAQLKTRLGGGKWNPEAGEVTVAEAINHYLAGRHDLRPGTISAYRKAVASDLPDYLASRPLRTLGPPQWREWVASMIEAGRAPKTINIVASVVRPALAQAEQDGGPITSWRGVKLPSKNSRPSVARVITPGQAAALAEVTEPRYRLAPLVGFHLGLRLGEVLALGVVDIDLAKGTLTVRHTLTDTDPGRRDGYRRAEPERNLWLGPTKNGTTRTLPLPLPVSRAITAHLAAHGTGPGGLVFSTPGGQALAESTFNRAWGRARKAAGLDGLRFHDLRHSHATLLLAAGEPVAEVAKRLGDTQAEVMASYSHARAGEDRALTDRWTAFVEAAERMEATEGEALGAGR